ncbi:hypothetical protein Scep_020144 [Stephania cephalantha]|uniref:Uncharacterized protein n=1 Tax=Stephania cephalantha TaxID=152367 RepID=A0AAP0IC89_9MAGN
MEVKKKMNKKMNKAMLKEVKVKNKAMKQMRKETEVEDDDEEENEEEDVKEVLEARSSAEGRVKAKSGPSGKEAADDSSDEPFPGGPPNKELLTSFHNHVAAAIWNNKAVDVVTMWKALLPSEIANTTAVKMSNDVLKHLTIFGDGGP